MVCDAALDLLTSLTKDEGTGIAGMISAVTGAERVVISDYPDPSIIANIEKNVKTNVEEGGLLELHQKKIDLLPHVWGSLSSPKVIAEQGKFSRILCADCLWIDGEHDNILRSMNHFLTRRGRVWVVAGYHKGDGNVAAFLNAVGRFGFCVESIQEHHDDGTERDWHPETTGVWKGGRGAAELHDWLVVAILKRVSLDPCLSCDNFQQYPNEFGNRGTLVWQSFVKIRQYRMPLISCGQ